MQHRRKKFFSRALWVFAITALILSGQRLYSWAAFVIPLFPDSDVLATVRKEHVTADDINQFAMEENLLQEEAQRKANVLFLVDTSNAMMLSPKGKLPYWNTLFNSISKTKPTLKYEALFAETTGAVNKQMQYFTFGVGMRPDSYVWGRNQTYRITEYLGRDVDNSNNEVGNPDHYYTTDPSKPYFLTFVDEKRANAPVLTSGWEQAERIPNDSRLYQTKLVFTRMLQEQELMQKLRFALATTHASQTQYLFGDDHDSGGSGHVNYKRRLRPSDPTNKRLLYHSDGKTSIKDANGNAISFPRRNWDAVEPSDFPGGKYRPLDYDANTNPVLLDAATGSFPHGTMQFGTYIFTNAPLFQPQQWSNPSSASNQAQSSIIWQTVNRAYLRIPFGEYTPEHVTKFRMLMDGVLDGRPADANSPSPFGMRNPELTTTGAANLAPAIFFPKIGTADGRNTLIKNKLIYYSHRDQEVTRVQEDSPGITNNDEKGLQIFGKGSGEAAGTIIDFFSPAVGKDASGLLAADANRYTAMDAVPENFPIRNRCDSNWLVIFTAGDDVGAAYKSHQAVKNLYDFYKYNETVRIIDPSKPPTKDNLEAIKLFNPIRTMVIGFVDDKDPDEDVQSLVTQLNLMADVGWDGEYNGVGAAYFANDVPGLIAALRTVLTTIAVETESRSVASTPALIAPTGVDAQGFLPGYITRSNDQWQGLFSHYDLQTTGTSEDKRRSVDVTPTWELHTLFKKYAANDHLSQKSSRKVAIWNWGTQDSTEGKLETLEFPPLSEKPHPLADRMGLAPRNFYPPLEDTDIHPSNLLIRWAFGQDYDRKMKNTFSRRTVLADMGNSGYTLLSPLYPSSGKIHSQPGYSRWIATVFNKNNPLVFFHTNDGLLHAVDARSDDAMGKELSLPWARERWAFIPPNVFEMQRLAGLKFRQSQVTRKDEVDELLQTVEWMDGGISKPGHTTDGAVYLYNLPGENYAKDQSDWRTILVGSLGRGGAGIYVLDVTQPDKAENVRFLWGVENQLNNYNATKKGAVYRWGSARNTRSVFRYSSSATTQRHDFDRLGFNAPAPLIGTTLVNGEAVNVGVLAGGMQYDLNLEKNGLMGAAIYLFDPATGEMHRNTDGDKTMTENNSVGYGDREAESVITSTGGNSELTGTPNPVVGMVLTPPAAITEKKGSGDDNTRYLEGFITADNRGQIFEGSFKEILGTGFTKDKRWHFRRIASLRDASEKDSGANYAIPHAMSIARDSKEDIWVFGGTADVLGRSIGEDTFMPIRKEVGVIRNRAQYLFGFKRYTSEEAFNQSSNLKKIVNLVRLGYETNDSTLLDQNRSADKMASGRRAWVIPLQEAINNTSSGGGSGAPVKQPDGSFETDGDVGAASGYEREYLSAPTLLFGDELYAATFIPQVPELVSVKECEVERARVNGISRLYRLEAMTGKGVWPNNDPKYLTFAGIKIGGITMATIDGTTRLFISITILDEELFRGYKGKQNTVLDLPGYKDAEAILHTDTLISLGITESNVTLPEIPGQFDYWRVLFAR